MEYFPHQLAWMLHNPLRRLLVSPGTVVDRLPLAEGARVLEIGPGSGYFSVEIARRLRGGRLELLDLQPEMLAKAGRNLRRAGFHDVGLTAHDASRTFPYPDTSFDVAFMVAVLGEVPDRAGCLREIRRVLASDGVLAVHEHHPDPHHIAPRELGALAAACGFVLRRRWGPDWNYTALFGTAT